MTALWTQDDLIEATGGRMDRPAAASGVSIDTRTLHPGDLFIALTGEHGDGHRHVPDAFARGATAAMVHAEASGGPLLYVDDTLAGLTRLGAYARRRFAGELVAITGSVGKTTTKEMLRRILATRGLTHAAVASYNNHWGVPLTLARTPPDAAFCIAEIGMNHPGEIEPLARLAQPHLAIITAVEKAHIGHLGSIEAIADEKASILRGVQADGLALLPADTPLLSRLTAAAGRASVMTFGAGATADARLLSVATNAGATSALLLISGDTIRLQMPAPGRHMALNALAAITAAAALGIPPQDAAAALADFTPMPGRGARRTIPVPGGDATLLDESYNGNGASMRAALSILRLLPAKRRIAVLGDMLELGPDGPAEHAALVPAVTTSADLLFCCGPLMRHLFDAVPTRLRGAHVADAAVLAEILPAEIRAGDAILVKGSLGSRMKQVVTALDRLAETA
jgi:UDP-N-acetylmuramoyl-tripeptide--D-alanyl-D-alanine ligase